jgi:hypothetical protein
MGTIISLIIGIFGFVKGRINVTKTRELRGGAMYLAATLFCLPLPLSLLAGFLMGATSMGRGASRDTDTVVGTLCTFVPILAAVIVVFALAKRKEA